MEIGEIDTYTTGFWIFKKTHYCVCYGNKPVYNNEHKEEDMGLTIGFTKHEQALAFSEILKRLEKIRIKLKMARE